MSLIDMVAAVSSFEDIQMFIDDLQKLGYEYMPQRMFDNRKFFPKGPREKRTHHLNLVLKDNYEQWVKPLAFRDYLRSHRAERKEYAKLKITLAAKHADDRTTYTQRKDEFFQTIFIKALSQHTK